MESIRAFIAIELPLEVKKELALLQEKLKAEGARNAKWVAPEGIHLTLKFLGNIPENLLTKIVKAMTKAASETPSFTLKTSCIGVFPNPRPVQIVWTAVEGDTEILKGLQKRLEQELKELGFPLEKRPFKAHLTLARMRNTATDAERRAVSEAVKKTKSSGRKTFTVNSLSLMSSVLTPQGAIYKRLSGVYLR